MKDASGNPSRRRRLGILGSPQGVYVRQLSRAAERRRIDMQVLSFAELSVSLRGPAHAELSILSRLAESLAEAAGDDGVDDGVDLLSLDGLIVRTMPLGSLEQVIFRMDALQALEHAGVPIVNPPRTLEIAIDKWLTLERLSRVGIPVPDTIACQTRDAAMAAFEQLGGDVVVKPLFGGEGRGIVRVSDVDMAWRVFGTLQQLGCVSYVQQFLPHFGYDIRVLIIGERLLSVKRRAAAGLWRTNLSQGSRAEPHELTEREEQLARSVARVSGGTLLGVDLLPTRDGRTVVLEVNAVPGWSGTSAALGVDVADLVIEHLEDLHAQRH